MEYKTEDASNRWRLATYVQNAKLNFLVFWVSGDREAGETIFYSLSEVGGIRDIGSSRVLPYTREGRRVNQGQARRHLVIEVLLESTPAFRADADTSRSVAQVGRVSQ